MQITQHFVTQLLDSPKDQEKRIRSLSLEELGELVRTMRQLAKDDKRLSRLLSYARRVQKKKQEEADRINRPAAEKIVYRSVNPRLEIDSMTLAKLGNFINILGRMGDEEKVVHLLTYAKQIWTAKKGENEKLKEQKLWQHNKKQRDAKTKMALSF